MQDDTFNYSVIKLIVSAHFYLNAIFAHSPQVALNEQFMVLGLEEGGHPPIGGKKSSEPKNRVIKVMNRRLGNCKTFGENMIFMLNRASKLEGCQSYMRFFDLIAIERTPEDFCMTLLILKILYVLFSNKGTCEFFYTNDLCVLVDVFLRELVDLDEENESVCHFITFCVIIADCLSNSYAIPIFEYCIPF